MEDQVKFSTGNRDKVHVMNDVTGIRLNAGMARDFLSLLPIGSKHPSPSSETIRRIREKPSDFSLKVFDGDEGDILIPAMISNMAKIALVNYLLPIGSCHQGRFIMVNEEDRKKALDFLESCGYEKGRHKLPDGTMEKTQSDGLRYRTIRDLDLGKTQEYINQLSDAFNPDAIPVPEFATNVPEEMQRKIEKRKIEKAIEKDIDETFKSPPEVNKKSVKFKDVHKHLKLISISPYNIVGRDFISEYEIDFDSIADYEDILIRAMHLLKKEWVTKDILYEFINVTLEHLKPIKPKK